MGPWIGLAIILAIISSVPAMIIVSIREFKKKEKEAKLELEKLLTEEKTKPRYMVKIIDIDNKELTTKPFEPTGKLSYWTEYPEVWITTSKERALLWIEGSMKQSYATINDNNIPTCNIKNMIPMEEK